MQATCRPAPKLRTTSGLFAAGALFFASLSTGCGPDCQSTCTKMFSQNECDIQRAGAEREELLDICEERCETALAKPGPADPDYNPADKMPPSQTTDQSTIETDVEAAMWMDCVEETACELIDEGYCWGIGL